MSAYPYLRALHLVMVVSWFAGLLYIVRLFIYHVEAQARPEPEKSILHAQFTLMEKRLWYAITWPAMVGTAIFGIWLMIVTRAYVADWFHLKLGLLVCLFAYHLLCGKIRRNLETGRNRLTSLQLRVWNETATLLLFAIVFTAVLKSPAGAGKAMAVVIAVAAAVSVIISVLRLRRQKQK